MKGPGNILNMIIQTGNSKQTLFVRITVSLVFISEGIQKFLFPAQLGTGRFISIGFSHPAFWAYFTASFEIICGLLLLAGLFSRIASIPLLIIMITAFITTKIPILTQKSFWPWAHEYRTDFAMTLLLVYLIIYGSGGWSIDALNSSKI